MFERKNQKFKSEGINNLDQKKVLILGIGREGFSTYKFLRSRYPQLLFDIRDSKQASNIDNQVLAVISKDKNLILKFGNGYLKDIDKYDIIFKSPGIPYSIPEIDAAFRNGVEITSNTKLFFNIFKGTIIGVTGTKGKSTTSSVIYKILLDSRKKVFLAGNIGIPLLSIFNRVDQNSYVVAELSSHQLADLDISPKYAVIQAIYQEHLDYYSDLKEYIQAKTRIVKYQDEQDFCVYNFDNKFSRLIGQSSKGRKFGIGMNYLDNLNCYTKNNWIVTNVSGKEEYIIKIEEIPLIGTFNLLNVMPAILVGKLLSLHNPKIANSIKNFKPLEHRMELVAETSDGIKFFNDSLSTIPEATINAIVAFHDQRIILIAGGFDRGQDFSELVKVIISSNIHTLILFPGTGIRIYEELMQIKSKKTLNIKIVETMEIAIEKAFCFAKRGDVVLLSPASPSFGLFVDYRDRGNQFKQTILNKIKKLQ